MSIRKRADLVIIGAGAAGIMASIWAGRTNPARSIIFLDGAKKLGAKILVSGGGRCNVTHHEVEASAFAGSSRHAIAKVLRRFGVTRTVEFYHELGVELKREETGKLFPTTDRAQTVLNALLTAAQQANVAIQHPRRVETVEKIGNSFFVRGEWGEFEASRVVLATGGKSLPKTGSDGHGFEIAKSLGHTITPRVFPALVPLTLPPGHFIRELSGLTVPATLEVRSSKGKKLIAFTNSTLCTHWGLSGPSALDISRYYLNAKFDDPATTLVINWWPGKSTEQLDAELQSLGRVTVLKFLRGYLPERLARMLCQQANLEPSTSGDQLTRVQRLTLARSIVTQMPLPITGDRGFNFAEVTAGGVPLNELHLNTMESRCCPGLYLCGEICDVDGRIGGFNFQWAWASGYVVGVAAGRENTGD
ncbi:MAG: NAD(P)/FAD-dependent oxidoreductase [bacterium]